MALIGEIYPAIRMIAYKYEPKKKHFTLIYYLERNPNEDDYESICKVMSKFISNFPPSAFADLSEECLYVEAPSKLDFKDVIAVYSRKEY